MSGHETTRRKHWVGYVLGAACAGAISLGAPATALAAEIRSGDTVTVGPNEVVNDDLYAFGSTVLIQGTVHGDVIAAGSSVTVAAHVTGSVMAAGSTLNISGPVVGGVRLAGNLLTVAAPVGGDALLAGSTLTVDPPGRIGRDVLAGGNSITLQAPVGRNVSVGGSTLTLGSTVGGAVNANVTDLVLGDGAVVQGPVAYTSNHEASVAGGARVENTLQRTAPPARPTSAWEIGGVDTLALVRGFIGLAALGIPLVLAFPRAAAKSVATIQSRWAASLGLGFALIVGIPVLAVLVFGVGLVVGGWWIGLLLLGLYAMLMVVGYLASADWLGLAVVRQMKTQVHPIWTMLLGLLILGLVGLVPLLGATVAFGAIVFGIGALALSAWQTYRGLPALPEATPSVGSTATPLPMAA